MFDYPCDWRSGFIMNPTKKQRVGYLTDFKGLDLGDYLKQDIEVFCPFDVAPAYTKALFTPDTGKIKVVGVIESYSFGGGVGDPISISAYISSENALSLQAKLKTTLTTTVVSQLGWWIANFDEEGKEWFEESFPKAPDVLSAQINAPGKTDLRLHIANEPTKIAANIDVNVVNIYFEVIPAANKTFDLHFATSKAKQFVKRWGLVVGTTATTAVSREGGT